MKEEIAQAVEQTRERFESLRATLSAKAAGLGNDAREAVEAQLKGIENRLDKAKADIERGTDEARLQAALATMEARDRWEAIQAELSTHIAKAKAEGQQTFDRLRMEAELDKLSAEVAIAARTAQAKLWFEQSVEQGEKTLHDMATRLKSAVNQSLEKLKSL